MPAPQIADALLSRLNPRAQRSNEEKQREPVNAANESPDLQARQDALQDEFWHDHYHLESYYVNGRGYDQYRPAYELGWRAAMQYPGDFASVMPVLEAQWQGHSGASLLDWRQVSRAVQAAWERMRHADPTTGLSHAQLLSMLLALQRLNVQTAKCLRVALVQAPTGLLQQMLKRHLQDFENASSELTQEFALPAFGKKTRRFSSSLQRGWDSLKAAIGPRSTQSLLDDSEDAERMLLLGYRTALRESLPEAARALLLRHAMAVQRGIEALHWLRSMPASQA